MEQPVVLERLLGSRDSVTPCQLGVGRCGNTCLAWKCPSKCPNAGSGHDCKTLQVPSWKDLRGGVLYIKDNLKCGEFTNAQDIVLPSLTSCIKGKFPFSDGEGSDLWDASPPRACRAKASSWINAYNSCLEMLSPDPSLCVWNHGLCSRDSFGSPESPSSA